MAFTKESQTKKQSKQKTKGKLPLPQLKAKVQRAVNKFCKERDQLQGCISCTKGQAEQGGHYIPQGSCSFLRYDFDNIHGQCVNCNHFKSGNLTEYRIALVKKIGLEKVEWLENHRHDVKKWTREELESLLALCV